MSVTALNPVDIGVLEGRVAPDAPLPRVVGVEGLGHHDDRRVIVSGHGVGLWRDGTLANQMAAPAEALFAVPDGAPSEQAVACGVAGATAVRVVALAEVPSDGCVLVLGAAGAVGGAVCQLLADIDATVLGQTRTADRADLIEEASATPVVVPDPDGLASLFDRHEPSVIIDSLGGGWTQATVRFAPPRARIVIYGASANGSSQIDIRTFYRKSLTLRGYSGMSERPELLSEAVSAALEECATGRLRFAIDRRVGLDEVAASYEAVASGSRGKVLVDTA